MNSDRSRVVTRSAGPDAWNVVIWGLVGLAIFCSGGPGVYIILGMSTEEGRPAAAQSGRGLVPPDRLTEETEEPTVVIPAPAKVDVERAVQSSSPADSLPVPPPENSSASPIELGNAPGEPPAPVSDDAILPQGEMLPV